MKNLIITILLVLPASVFASGGSGYPLDHFEADLTDKESLKNGAEFFVNNCMGCHSAQYSRYGRVAEDLGMSESEAMDLLIFDDSKIGSLMKTSMPEKLAKKWFGAAPPDLTLVARARSPEWLYTYLRTFYKDPARPYGVNNKVFPDVGMPHVLLGLQGVQECVPGTVGEHHDDCASLKVTEKGSLSTEEYDKKIYDLVNFLEYVGEPMALERVALGKYVLIFLFIFLIPAYFLNREYWKDVH